MGVWPLAITVLVVGRVRGALVDGVAEYESRAARYWRLEVVEVSVGGKGSRIDPTEVMDAEGQKLLARAPAEAELVALSRKGRAMTSSELARHLERRMGVGGPGVAFVIGGAFGLSKAVLARASTRFSLSGLTLPHEMARLVLAEQLYRAGTILRSEPYHKLSR